MRTALNHDSCLFTARLSVHGLGPRWDSADGAREVFNATVGQHLHVQLAASFGLDLPGSYVLD